MNKTLIIIVLMLIFTGALHCESYIQLVAEPGIKVFLDGTFKGETNSAEEGLVIEGVTAGNHKIKCVKTGFIEQEADIKIKSGEVLSYFVKPFIPKIKITQFGEGQGDNIVQKTGTLKIQSIPVDIHIKIARLGVDGKKEKDEWKAEKVPIGSYNAVFTRKDKRVDYSVKITENELTHLMVNMFTGKVEVIKKEAAEITKTNTQANNLNKSLNNEMVFVEGGTFQMGSNDGDDDEKPVHSVTVSDFYIGKYEVTQEQYEKVMDKNPSQKYGVGNKYPVYYVSWYDAVAFCNKLSEKEGLTKCYTGSGDNIRCDFHANGYRLPTEAEWEFAARGGNKSKSFKYSGSNDIGDVGWYRDNSGSKTHPVGGKKANELGIYDMSGNVWEWCWDWKGDYSSGYQTDPKGPSTGVYRVNRRGSWYDKARNCRSALRSSGPPDCSYYGLGFRLARSLPR